MKLFTFATSPYARKVRMALDYKGVSYEPIERCYSIDRKEDLRCVNLRAEVPTLVLDDGRMIADSTIICEYIEDAYPQPPLCPKDSYERARMRMIEDLCDRAFDAASFGMGLAMLRNEAPEASAIREAASKELRALLGVLDCELGEREFFCGDLSLADLAAVCHVHDARELPRLHAWMQVCAALRWLAQIMSASVRRSLNCEVSLTNSRVPTAAFIGATAAWNGRCATALSISSRASSTQAR